MKGASERAAQAAGSPSRRGSSAVLPMAMRALPQASLPLEAELSPAPWVVSMPRGDATPELCVWMPESFERGLLMAQVVPLLQSRYPMVGMPRGCS